MHWYKIPDYTGFITPITTTITFLYILQSLF